MVVEVVFSDEIREERIYNRVVILVYAHTLYTYITMRGKFNG